MTTTNTSEKAALEATIFEYFGALNAGDIDAALKLYTDDPVQLPFMQPTIVGTEAVRRGYEGLFGLIRFQMHTKIAELVQMSTDWAFVRTESAGMMTPVR